MRSLWEILTISMISLDQVLQAVKVFEFGTTMEENTRVVIRNDKQAPEAFTLCLDFYSRIEKYRRLLQAKSPDDLEIQIGENSLVIYVRVAGIWYLAIPESPPYIDNLTWDTLCVSFDIKNQAITVAFRNRILVEEEQIFPNRTLSKDFLNDMSLGKRDRLNHFAGDITRMNIWSKVLGKDILVNITNCDEFELRDLPDFLNWAFVDAAIEGAVIEREFPDYPCKGGADKVIKVLMPEPAVSMFDAVKTCAMLNGNLSFPSKKEEVTPFLDEVRSKLSESKCHTYVWANYYKNSYADNNWTIYESETTYYYPPYKYPGWLEWELGQPNGKHLQKCAGIDLRPEKKSLDDLECYDKGYCFMCR